MPWWLWHYIWSYIGLVTIWGIGVIVHQVTHPEDTRTGVVTVWEKKPEEKGGD